MTPTFDQISTCISENALPFVINTEEEYEKALSISEKLFFKKDRTKIEEQILDVWVALIEMYEEKTFNLGATSTPVSILSSLMESRGMNQADLVREGVASSGVISDIINNKRKISNQLAKKLGQLFNVSPNLFIQL